MKRWPLHKAYFWETAPFFRILLPFAAGILVYDRAWFSVSAMYLLAIILLSFLLYTVIVYTKKSGDVYRVVVFSMVNIVLFFSGFICSHLNDVQNNKSWFGNTVKDKTSYLVQVTDNPSEKEHSWKLPVTVISSIESGKVAPVKGNAFVYLYKDQMPMSLHKGDSILIPGKWQPIKNTGNPFEFDYATYCRRNNILYQQTCSVNDIRLYAANEPDAVSFLDRSHEWCMAQLDKYITDPKTKGLIQAMLLGDEVNLDEDLRQSYSETGIIHIIAISGGNVAIFFIVISFLLRWMKNKKHLWIKYAIALPMVWFYVLMAGAPPSAIRAAVMFSLLAFSVILQKDNNSLNTLFATAFVLLYAQPMWLFSVGFQLSFVAVLSLILFYTPVFKWLSLKYKIARWLWGAVAASIAAEILVAPLVIYYFHTFPLLFIVANVLAYLFMSLVLIAGIAIVALSFFIPVVAKILGLCTVWLVTFFDHIVTWLQGCNPVSFHFLMLTSIELLLAYAVITGVVLFLMRKQKPALFTGLIASCFLFTSFCTDEWQRLHQQRIIVYNTAKANHVELIDGATYSVLTTDTGLQKKIDYAVKPAHINWRAWKRDSTAKNEIFEVNGKTALILNEEINIGAHFPVSCLILNYTGNPDLTKLQKTFSPSVIVIGNNYTRAQQEKLAKEGLKAGVAIHAISDMGAFILDRK